MLLLFFIFSALHYCKLHVVYYCKNITSFEQPLSYTCGPVVQKVDNAFHCINHYPVGIASGGYS